MLYDKSFICCFLNLGLFRSFNEWSFQHRTIFLVGFSYKTMFPTTFLLYNSRRFMPIFIIWLYNVNYLGQFEVHAYKTLGRQLLQIIIPWNFHDNNNPSILWTYTIIICSTHYKSTNLSSTWKIFIWKWCHKYKLYIC